MTEPIGLCLAISDKFRRRYPKLAAKFPGLITSILTTNGVEPVCHERHRDADMRSEDFIFKLKEKK